MNNDQKAASLAGIEKKIESLLRRMTLQEKIKLLAGKDWMHSSPVERLKIFPLGMNDGPQGVNREETEATAFPASVAMAATWDPTLITRVGQALAEETGGIKNGVLLGPCVNIMRTPLAGRNFECLSEDPYLAGKIGAAYVRGVQSRGVSVCVKHFACNNQEFERSRGNSVVDERTLREIYLAQFEMIVKDAGPWAVMCSYNRVNGVYASENGRLLNEILRKEWGYRGVVVSDWRAVHSIIASLENGLDLEMPGKALYRGRLLFDAVTTWQVKEDTVNEAVRRMLQWFFRCRKIGPQSAGIRGSVNTPEHQRLARVVAEASVTLLKNEDNVLPLDLRKLKSIAVIGPAAQDFPAGGRGAGGVNPPYRVNPLKELRKRAGQRVRILYAQGCDNADDPPLLSTQYLRPAGKGGSGLTLEFFNNPDLSGKPVFRRVDRELFYCFGCRLINSPPQGVNSERFSARWSGTLCVPRTGKYLFRVNSLGWFRLYIDDRLVLRYRMPEKGRNELNMIPERVHTNCTVNLTQGKAHRLRIEYRESFSDYGRYLKVRFAEVSGAGVEASIARAAALAGRADAALVFVGLPEGWEAEGIDRLHMDLTGYQDELVRRVAQANPKTVVVLTCGAPVTMPWLDKVAGLLAAYYPGMEGGSAVVRALLGEVNPSGKLPVTFPRRYEDNPTYRNYPGDREVIYKEGIFVGYRHYDAKKVEPLFPFGFGLSYTTFKYDGLKVPSRVKAGQPVTVRVRVANAGSRAGKEVVQLYVGDKSASLPRPPKELKGFEKVALAPGESREVRFTLDKRAFSFYNPVRKQWVAEPGEFEIMVGGSSRGIQRQATVRLMP